MQTVEKVVYWIPWIIFEMASYQSVKICTFTLRYSGYLRNVSVPSWGACLRALEGGPRLSSLRPSSQPLLPPSAEQLQGSGGQGELILILVAMDSAVGGTRQQREDTARVLTH